MGCPQRKKRARRLIVVDVVVSSIRKVQELSLRASLMMATPLRVLRL
jgi:hypothetical protein